MDGDWLSEHDRLMNPTHKDMDNLRFERASRLVTDDSGLLVTKREIVLGEQTRPLSIFDGGKPSRPWGHKFIRWQEAENRLQNISVDDGGFATNEQLRNRPRLVVQPDARQANDSIAHPATKPERKRLFGFALPEALARDESSQEEKF